MPICGRCIASGAPCDYGISNQGGRWKDGKKLGGIRHETRPSVDSSASTSAAEESGMPMVSESPISDRSFPDAASAGMTQHPAIGDPAMFRHSFQENNIWGYDLSMCQQNAFTPFAGPTPLPPASSAFPSPLSSASSFWLPPAGAPTSESDQSDDFMQSIMPSALDRPKTCTCFVSTLSVLQSLHQRFPQGAPVQHPMDPSNLSYTAVLDMNEQASSCCATMLRCPVCRADDTGYSFILLTTLIRKTLTMIESWVALPANKQQQPQQQQQQQQQHQQGDDGQQSNMSPTSSGLPSSYAAAAREDDRRLKAEVSLIGIKKMEEISLELRLASQGIRVDYDRLACASLAASLSARLRAASDMLSVELDNKASIS
ncbi:MAG: hypothetical protein LQ340_002964 [Diploschistes diacapsis]|nr:MAG: hypothetical protein LQ340_002964 [Diploschistes diacapsis]